jgi:hypothetical protein
METRKLGALRVRRFKVVDISVAGIAFTDTTSHHLPIDCRAVPAKPHFQSSRREKLFPVVANTS